MIRFIGRVVLPCLALLGLCGCKPKAESGPILIGHVAALSGPDQQLGEHARQAILLAVEKANQEENGIAGRPVAVLHMDPHGDLDALQPEAVRLITVNRVVALLGGMNAAQVERLGRAAQPYEVALVTPAAVPTDVLSENVFSVNASPAFQGQVLARFAAGERKAERVAILVDGRQAGQVALAEAFSKEFAQNARHTLRQYVYKSEADLAKAIEESKPMKPQAVLYAGARTELAKAQTLLQAAGLTIPLLLGDDGQPLAALEGEPKPSTDMYLAIPYLSEGGTPEQQGFAKDYQGRFHEPPDTHALLTYDGIRVLLQAMRRAKWTSAKDAAARVRDELARSNELETLAGRLYFSKDHWALRPLFVAHFQNGRMGKAQRFDPPEAK